MVVSKDVQLPTEEELTVPEVNVSSAVLRAAAFHLGKDCENVNNEFMLCKAEYPRDPRKCLNEGKEVTKCSLDFFKKMKANCRHEFEAYAHCVDKSSTNFKFSPCRNTQGVYDNCMLEKLNIERPYWGYFAETKVHDSPRPKPPLPAPEVYSDASEKPPPGFPKDKAKYDANFAV